MYGKCTVTTKEEQHRPCGTDPDFAPSPRALVAPSGVFFGDRIAADSRRFRKSETNAWDLCHREVMVDLITFILKNYLLRINSFNSV